ncbi:hypothetical protein BU17DRAFT_79444 [Hysterangium stoloniferum]|nr:hypothetical protein BU17DRAFT_79444 [Hysterangium stoloniferum]
MEPSFSATSCLIYHPPKLSPTGCKKTIGVISETLHGSPPALVAEWPKFWSTHLLLHHQDKDLFNISAISVFPSPFPNRPKNENGSHPFAVEFGQGLANFIFTREAGVESQRVDGIAITGAWGPGSPVKALAGRDRESAEMWFDRVV